MSAVARTRREASADDTRRKITVAAIELVQEVGWRDATVERIAAKAGVAKGTFFVHFANKEALAPAFVGIQVGAARRAREKIEGRSADERLRETVLTLGRHAGSSIELSRAVFITMMQNNDVARSIDASFAEVYAQMIADAADVVPGAKAETLASLLMSCYLGAALHHTTSPRPGRLEDVLAPLVEATLAAFVTPQKKTRRKKR